MLRNVASLRMEKAFEAQSESLAVERANAMDAQLEHHSMVSTCSSSGDEEFGLRVG